MNECWVRCLDLIIKKRLMACVPSALGLGGETVSCFDVAGVEAPVALHEEVKCVCVADL